MYVFQERVIEMTNEKILTDPTTVQNSTIECYIQAQSTDYQSSDDVTAAIKQLQCIHPENIYVRTDNLFDFDDLAVLNKVTTSTNFLGSQKMTDWLRQHKEEVMSLYFSDID